MTPVADTSGHLKVVSHKARIHNAGFNIVIKNGYLSPNIWAKVEYFSTPMNKISFNSVKCRENQ